MKTYEAMKKRHEHTKVITKTVSTQFNKTLSIATMDDDRR